MKIDSHIHFWKYNSETYSWISDEMSAIRKDFTPGDLQPHLKKNGFSGCVAVQADQSEKETTYLLKMANKHSFIKGVVGWVDLASKDVEAKLKDLSKNPVLKGLRHTEWDEKGEFMAAQDFQRGIGLLANLGLTYDLLVFDYQLAAAVKLAQAFTRQKFVLDHMGKPKISRRPGKKWTKQIQQLAEQPNVWCKISGLVTQTSNLQWKKANFQPFLEVVTESFGVDRIMFGSDWPVSLSTAEYHEVVKIVEDFFSSYSKEDKLKIFGQNASDFYNLNMK